VTEKCPTTGFTCVDRLTARVQACIDQANGLIALVEGGAFSARAEHLLKHYSKVAELLQEAVDEYVESHQQPDVLFDVEAVQWVLKALRP